MSRGNFKTIGYYLRTLLVFGGCFILFSFISLNFYSEKKSLYTQSRSANETYQLIRLIPDLTIEEETFPLAYSILIYRDADQAFRLLKAIYRPSNFYCIHVDIKSEDVWYAVQHQWPKLKNNVIILNQERISVTHSTFSVLQADLLCIRALYKQFLGRWKYFINLTGQEWPLKTNLELVRILRAMNKSNIMEKITINPNRLPQSIPNPPNEVTIWKGAVHIIVTYEFVDFMLNNNVSLQLLKYIEKYVGIPDEAYFSTLNHNPSLAAPGGYKGTDMTNDETYPQLMRLKHWIGNKGQDCHGKNLRGICIWGVEDVSTLTSLTNKELFVNKFIMDINSEIFNIIESWFWTRQDYVYKHPDLYTNVSYYSNLPVVTNHW